MKTLANPKQMKRAGQKIARLTAFERLYLPLGVERVGQKIARLTVRGAQRRRHGRQSH